MKIFWIVLAVVVLGLATNALIMYLVQKRRQARAEKDGIVVYATLVSAKPMGGLLKYADMQKVTLRLQDPGTTTPREVSMRTRMPPGQKAQQGMKLAVIIDPRDPKRVIPASPEAAKRAVVTGSRLERRHLRMDAASQRQAAAQQQRGGNIPYPQHFNKRRG